MTRNPSERAFGRRPGRLTLVLGWTLGPLVALWNQLLIYQANMWACGRDQRWAIHIVPLLCLTVTVGTGFTAHRDWKVVGAGAVSDANDVTTRVRFLAIGGVVISSFCALVIIAQWAAVFVFAPCMRV